MPRRKVSLKEQFGDDTATIEFLKAQKPATKQAYKHQWRKFLKFIGMTGNQILEDRKNDTTYAWEKKVIAFRDWLLNQKMSTATARTASGAVRAFFGFHRTELKFRRGEAKRLTEHQRKYEDYRFSRDDLRRMAQVADLQGKYIVTAGKSFGLRVGDFKNMARGDLEPYLDREVPIGIGAYGTKKEMVKAYPFIDSDALPIIRLMIAQMDREGRTDPNDRILTLKSNVQLSRILKSLATKAGINPGNKIIRFHCLRKFLIDRLSRYMSESKWKQIIGKKISEKAYVSEDELREDYARVMAETCWTGMPETDIEKRITIAMLKKDLEERAKTYGLTKDDLKAMFVTFDVEDYRKWLREHPTPPETRTNGGQMKCQRIVSEEELGGYLAKGWKVQATLPSGRIVVDNEH